MLLIGGTTFLFAGSYFATLLLPAALCALLAVAWRPWREAEGSRAVAVLDAWLIAIGVLIAVQLLPLPGRVIDRLSPQARAVSQHLELAPGSGTLPISVNPWSTAKALAVYGCAIAVFLVCRRLLARGGVRVLARGIGTIGLLLAAVSLAQDATGHGLIYWRWKPPFEVAAPFGPFINRNHFATWVVMAIPLSIGYLLAHGSAHARADQRAAHWRSGLGMLADARSIWLTAAICLMLVGLVASLSRAGLVGMMAAIVTAAFLRRRTAEAPGSIWPKAAIGLGVLAAALRVNPLEVFHRFSAAGAAAADRLEIWRAALPVIEDFWLTGTGAGTFETVMLVYQRTPSLFRINAAHNHYLQVAAEGGLLLAIPAAVAIALVMRLAWRSVHEDASAIALVRIGAASGLIGVAVQSVWETGLTTPANALLAAVLAAIALHRPPQYPGFAG